MDGTQTYYYGSGKEKEINVYVKGLLNGTTTTFHINGQKNITANYIDGKKDGYYISRYMNGAIEEEGWYKEDLLEGEWLMYNEFGTLTKPHRFLK